MKKSPNQEAKELAIPLENYESLPAKAIYMIKNKVPEAMAQYWELEDFTIYLIKKHKLTKETFRSFIFDTNNSTQKDRELLVAWFFTKFIAGLQRENLHYALALPEEDRGIECYIRIVDFAAENVAGLPIQVCDIPLHSDSIDESRIEEVIFSASVKAKAKPTDCIDAILILHALGRGKDMTISIDRFKMRDLFDKQNWTYRKIIFQIDSEDITQFFTVYCDDVNEHFRGIRKNGGSKIIIGRTLLDEKRSGKFAEKVGSVNFGI